MRITFFLICSLALFSFTTQAQTPSDAHLKAADKLVTTFLSPDKLEKSYLAVYETMLNQVPVEKRQKMKDVLLTFSKKYAGYDIIKPEMTRFYAETFSEAEIAQLTKFFLTPVGMKYIDESPRLAQKAMQIGQKAVQEHAQELQDEFKKVLAE